MPPWPGGVPALQGWQWPCRVGVDAPPEPCLSVLAVLPWAQSCFSCASSPLVTDCCGWAGLQLENKASSPAGWRIGTVLGWVQADEGPGVPKALVWV